MRNSKLFRLFGVLEFVCLALLLGGCATTATNVKTTAELSQVGKDNLIYTAPLHDAAERGNIEQVKELVGKGDSVSAKDESGNTPLHLAAVSDNIELTSFLLDSGAPINARNDLGVTALIIAVYKNNFDVARLLVSSGADPNTRDSDRSTALSLAWKKKTLGPHALSDIKWC